MNRGVLFTLLFLTATLGITVHTSYAQVANTEVGGPTVPVFTSTQSQYCSSGTCQTGITYTNGTASSNDTANQEHARYPNIIMLIPSENCLTAIKNHVKTGCPPLENLTKYDTSNQNISGKFVKVNGILERTNPEIKNHWMFYAYSSKTIICVYCTGNFLIDNLYKTITITPADFAYIPQTFQSVQQTSYIHNGSGWLIPINSSVNEINSGLNVQLNRNVDPNCSNAVIKYSDYLLSDTIKYMESDCKTTNYNVTNTMKVPNTPWVYDNPYSTLHLLQYEKSIMGDNVGLGGNYTHPGGFGPPNCQSKHTSECNFIDPYKKVGY